MTLVMHPWRDALISIALYFLLLGVIDPAPAADVHRVEERTTMLETISITRQQLSAAFDTWHRQMLDHPEEFAEPANPDTYGAACANYLITLVQTQKGGL